MHMRPPHATSSDAAFPRKRQPARRQRNPSHEHRRHIRPRSHTRRSRRHSQTRRRSPRRKGTRARGVIPYCLLAAAVRSCPAATEPKAVACLTRFAGRTPGETPRHGNPQVAGDEHWMREGPCVGMFQRIRGKPARTRPLHLQEAASGTITQNSWHPPCYGCRIRLRGHYPRRVLAGQRDDSLKAHIVPEHAVRQRQPLQVRPGVLRLRPE